MQDAMTCITVVNEIAYLLVQVPFGTSPTPAGFSLVSNLVGDLAQNIATHPNWDPCMLQSSFNLDFPPTFEPNTVPFGKVDELAITLPSQNIVTNNFFGDLFQVGLNIDDNVL